MAKDNAFSGYYTNRNLTKAEFYSVADTLYDLNNFWMLSGFIRQNRQVLFQEIQTSMDGVKRPDFTETCKFGKDTMLIVICRRSVYNKNRRIQSFPAVIMLESR